MGDRPKNPELWPAHYAREKARDSKRRPAKGLGRPRLTSEVIAAREVEKAERKAAKEARIAHNAATKKRRAYKAQRKNHLKRAYGLTEDGYLTMLATQSGGCAICGGSNDDGRKLFVDHDHETGAVRALLCTRCNSGLGHFKDNPDRLRLAAAYLERYKCA